MTARYLVGDVFDRLAELPDDSVDLVLTSPPFLALRSYLPADHPDKAKELGSEATPAEFIDSLLRLTAEWGRVLAPHGSICVELGDTYAGSNAGGERTDGGQYGNWPSGGTKYNLDTRPAKGTRGWPLDKSLCGIPHLYHLSLAYGRNLLTGEASPAGQWRVRNVVAWCRPNPPVGALGDKFRPATSYMTVATRARDRWFDLDAVRTDYKPQSGAATQVASRMRTDPEYTGRSSGTNGRSYMDGAGAPPLDWWDIPTQPYRGAHYATWPERLCVRPIESMCPRQVCTVCGEPRRRIVDSSRIAPADDSQRRKNANGERPHVGRLDRVPEVGWEYERTTIGWTDCGHGSWRPGVVLDPFAGSGTTLAVAVGHGRDAIGIDLDARNADLALERVGMFLTVDTREDAA